MKPQNKEQCNKKKTRKKRISHVRTTISKLNIVFVIAFIFIGLKEVLSFICLVLNKLHFFLLFIKNFSLLLLALENMKKKKKKKINAHIIFCINILQGQSAESQTESIGIYLCFLYL